MPLFAPVRRLAAAPLLLLLALALPACDSAEPTSPDTVLAGVNFTRLFAPATPAETAAVRAEWAARSPAAAAVTVSGPATTPDGARIFVVSHQMTTGPGAPLTHYGFVRVPAGLADDAPVLVVHHGGDTGVKAESDVIGLSQVFPALFARTVQVFPSYRAEPLVTDVLAPVLGPTQTSGGTASPWDYDVDDSMALLSAVLAHPTFDPATDDGRVAALGFSRGGNTALLHAARDARIDAVTDYFGPSDFFNPSAQQLALALIGGLGPDTATGALRLPGARFLLDRVLDPLRGADDSYNDGANYAAARLEVVRRSASQFTAGLRNVQMHHHRRDAVVPVAFSVAFDVAAQAARPQGAYQYILYGEAATAPADLNPSFHSPLAMPESLARTQDFLGQYAIDAPGARLVAAY